MKLDCPKCRVEIPLEDVNVATDIALCRRCGETYSFAELSQDRAVADMDTSQPPGGAWYRSQGNEFEVGAVSRSGAAFFLVPFTLLWSGGSLGGIYGTQFAKGRFDLTQSLFGIPFLLGSLVLIPHHTDDDLRQGGGMPWSGLPKPCYSDVFESAGGSFRLRPRCVPPGVFDNPIGGGAGDSAAEQLISLHPR